MRQDKPRSISDKGMAKRRYYFEPDERYALPKQQEEDEREARCHLCSIGESNDDDSGLVMQAESEDKEVYICSKCKEKHVSMIVSKHGYQIWELKQYRQETLNF